jgi:hypothetical protein
MTKAKKLERMTVKKWGTYPRCQHVDKGEQCKGTTYSNDRCWGHYATKRVHSALSDALNDNQLDD